MRETSGQHRDRELYDHSLLKGEGWWIAHPVFVQGTTEESWDKIRHAGLMKMERTHVHLPGDLDTARAVAKRRQGPHVILRVESSTMFSEGYHFFLADNGVWLCESVPPQFLTPLPDIF